MSISQAAPDPAIQMANSQRQPPGAGERRVRVRNAGAVDFDEVRVFFPDRPDEAVSYGPVKKGAVSDYKSVGRAYRYAHIEAVAGGRQFVLRPMDYVGEEELPPGRFTYVLRTEADRLSIALERDG